MQITSVLYLAFLAISLLLYWNIPYRYQWWVLLADSLIFFFLNSTSYTFLYLLLCVLSLYYATLYFTREADKTKRKRVLLAALVLNLGMLGALKYTNLFIQTANYFASRQTDGTVYHTVNWLAPIAISYYTLQAVAYLLDCYWGIAEPEKNLGKLFVFISYFPLMVSGPICRHGELGTQLFEERRFEYDRVTRGCRRIAWGIAKKVVVADRIAFVVNCIFGNQSHFSGVWVWLAVLAYVAQLYFDFSGCMDIVIGASACFGIMLPENFRAPFLSRSVQEFWRRWHITLGLWLKDYVMFPLLKSNAFVKLGKSCRKKLGKSGKMLPSYLAMLIVWTLNGLWHGGALRYIVGVGWWFWIVATLGQLLKPQLEIIKRLLGVNDESLAWKSFQVVRTVLIVSVGIVFFRTASIMDAFRLIAAGFDFSDFQSGYIWLRLSDAYSGLGGWIPCLIIVMIGALQVFCDAQAYREKDVQKIVIRQKTGVRWLLYFALLFMIALGGAFGQSQFIYFGF